MVLYTVLGLLIVLTVVFAALYRREKNKPVPVAPAPEPKVFGAYEARKLRADLGGSFRPGDGRVVKLAMLASGTGFRVVEDIETERKSYNATIADEQGTIERYEAKIGACKAEIARATAANADAASLADAFFEV